VGIKHAWQSAASDGSDATKLQPSKWNADHVGGFDNPMTIGGDLIFANPAGQATDVSDSGPYSGAATAYVIPQITGLTAGVTYTVQFECGSNHTMGWRVDAFPTGGGALVASSSTVYTDNGMGWSSQTLTITLPAGSTEIRIWTGTDWSWHIQNIYVKHAATLPDRLPIGSSGDILQVSGGIPTWIASTARYEDPFTTLSGWTQLGTLDTSSVSDVSGYWHVKRACSSEIDGIYKAVPGAYPYTMTVKVPAYSLVGNTFPALGIMLLDSGPTAIREFSFNWASGTTWSVSLRRYTNRTTFSTSIDVTVPTNRAPWIYLRLLVTSSSSVTFSYSWDGLVWIVPPTLTAISPTITPAYWGLLLSDPLSASTPEAFYRLPVIT
jgi:hypothetical protein